MSKGLSFSRVINFKARLCRIQFANKTNFVVIVLRTNNLRCSHYRLIPVIDRIRTKCQYKAIRLKSSKNFDINASLHEAQVLRY